MLDDVPYRRYVRLACALGALAVIAGAFGAHGLESQLDEAQLGIWQTAATYQMYHALALLAFAGGAMPKASARLSVWACRAWLAGIAIFSGSLYLLAGFGIKWLGAITPIGGLALISGWILAAMAIAKPTDR